MRTEKFIKGQYAIIVGPVNRQKIMAVLLLKKSKLSNKWKVFSRLYNEEFWVSEKYLEPLDESSDNSKLIKYPYNYYDYSDHSTLKCVISDLEFLKSDQTNLQEMLDTSIDFLQLIDGKIIAGIKDTGELDINRKLVEYKCEEMLRHNKDLKNEVDSLKDLEEKLDKKLKSAPTIHEEEGDDDPDLLIDANDEDEGIGDNIGKFIAEAAIEYALIPLIINLTIPNRGFDNNLLYENEIINKMDSYVKYYFASENGPSGLFDNDKFIDYIKTKIMTKDNKNMENFLSINAHIEILKEKLLNKYKKQWIVDEVIETLKSCFEYYTTNDEMFPEIYEYHIKTFMETYKKFIHVGYIIYYNKLKEDYDVFQLTPHNPKYSIKDGIEMVLAKTDNAHMIFVQFI